MSRWSEEQLADFIARDGCVGAPNLADTRNPPFHLQAEKVFSCGCKDFCHRDISDNGPSGQRCVNCTSRPAEVVISLPMPPSTNNLFFNARPSPSAGWGGRTRTPEYVAWVKEAGTILASQRPPQVLGKVSLLIEVQEPETKRRQDVANREKAVTDLLVTHRVIEGDDQRFVREITMRWAPVDGVRATVRACQ